jgi:hypothetical protein
MKRLASRVLLALLAMLVLQVVLLVVFNGPWRGPLADALPDVMREAAFARLRANPLPPIDADRDALDDAFTASSGTDSAAALVGDAWEPWTGGERTLDWPRFVVEAHLDSSGRLFVRETQTMRFRGDWNGGERTFTVGFGQHFHLHRLSRLETATGTVREMVRGNLDVVDGWDWSDASTVRWRSRLPTDPPFSDAERTYVLEYDYGRILVPTDSGWLLDHEFGFRQREGSIADFRLSLTLDPAWRAPSSFAGRWRETDMAPGLSFLVTVPLRHVGAGEPSSALRGAPTGQRQLVAWLAIVVMGLLTLHFLWRERAVGRFAPVPWRDVTPDWIRRTLLPLRAEVVGAAWDMHVGPAEVAALLARLVTEGKLASRVRTKGKGWLKVDVLHLDITTSRERFTDYESELLDRLFVPGSRSTSTEKLRERYERTGFDPAFTIRRGVLSALDTLSFAGSAEPVAGRARHVALVAVPALAAGALATSRSAFDATTCAVALGVAVAGTLVAGNQAMVWRDRVIRPLPHTLRFLVPLAALAWALLQLAHDDAARIGLASMACASLLLLSAVVFTFETARSRQSPERMAFRKQLAAARLWFRAQLAQPSPQLEDAWYPYLLAFGLNRHVNRWFKRFGAAEVASRTSRTDFGRSASSGVGGMSGGSSTGSGWSGFGGGGGFGGAGATVAFGAAVASFSSGVSAPSSSSGSGGGSSSSGGSSGGGGGGGW